MRFSTKEKEMLQLIQRNPHISIEGICETLFMSRTSVTKYMKRLRTLGIVVHRGTKKYGYYEIINPKALEDIIY